MANYLKHEALYVVHEEKVLEVIMSMSAHFLSRLVQREAHTGGLIFLLRQSAEGWRVSVRPLGLCAHKCSHVYLRVPCVCALAFFIRV